MTEGASNNIITRSFTVTVNPVNQIPTLNALGSLAINQNVGSQSVTLGGITSGSPNENQTLTVTSVSSNPALVPNPTVTYTSPNTSGSLNFAPVSNATGNANITVTVNDGGASNNIVTRSFTVTVNPINQIPTLNALSNLTINQNAGAQSIALTGITSGSPNENQTLTVTAVSSNPALVPNPTVTYTSPNISGSLNFAPVSNATGKTTITVTVNDGGASNNIITRSFTVTVNPVNQIPTLNALSNLTINQNAGAQSVALAGITSGSPNENQTLTVTSISSNPSLIPNPIVTYTSPNTTGSLAFTPAINAAGTNIITVTVKDGGTSNNIVTRSFTVIVNPVAGGISITNHPPTLNLVKDKTAISTLIQQSIALSGISSGDPMLNQKLKIKAVSSNRALVPNPSVSYSSPKSTGTLKFFSMPGMTGKTAITVTVTDDGAPNRIVTQTFIINVLGVGLTQSGKPVIKKMETTNSAVAGQNLTFAVTATGTGPLKYQWKFNGNDITSETNAVLNINQVNTTQSGSYSVIVFNSRGAVKSAATTLTIAPNPDIPHLAKSDEGIFAPPTITLTPGTFVNGQFSFDVTGAPNYQCIVQISTNLVDWVSVETNLTPFIFTDYNAGEFGQRFYRTAGK